MFKIYGERERERHLHDLARGILGPLKTSPCLRRLNMRPLAWMRINKTLAVPRNPSKGPVTASCRDAQEKPFHAVERSFFEFVSETNRRDFHRSPTYVQPPPAVHVDVIESEERLPRGNPFHSSQLRGGEKESCFGRPRGNVGVFL